MKTIRHMVAGLGFFLVFGLNPVNVLSQSTDVDEFQDRRKAFEERQKQRQEEMQQRREEMQQRRQEKQEKRDEFRENRGERRDAKQERRQDKREKRDERKDARQDKRQDRKQEFKGRRDDRQENRQGRKRCEARQVAGPKAGCSKTSWWARWWAARRRTFRAKDRTDKIRTDQEAAGKPPTSNILHKGLPC